MNPIPVDKNSESEIFRASVILLFKVQKVSLTPWVTHAPQGVLTRNAEMTCAIREILKGQISQKPEEPFQLTVTQAKPVGDVYLTDYGNWSKADIEAGKSFLVFCQAPPGDASRLLEEGNFERLLDPEVYLRETHAALTLEARGTNPAELLTLAASNASKTQEIFPHYLWAKAKAEILRTPNLFESYCGLIESNETSVNGREAYLSSLEQGLSLIQGPSSLPFEKRFLLTQFRLLVEKKKEDLGKNMISVHIPNSLGLRRGEPIVSARELFKDAVPLRETSESVLKESPDKAAAKPLLDWIQKP